MTLQDILAMTQDQFEEACKAAHVHYSTPINTDQETMEQAIDGFANFNSTPNSVQAIHAAGRIVP